MRAGKIYKTVKLRSGEEIILRSIRWSDLDTLLEFINSLAKESFSNEEFGLSFDKLMTREEEMRWLASSLVDLEEGNLINVSAFHNDKIVGNSDIRREKRADRKHHGILGIAVLNEWRNKGVGREMMLELFEQARRESITNLQLEVLSRNINAIHLYEELGFKKIGVMPKKVLRNSKYFDVLYMHREL